MWLDMGLSERLKAAREQAGYTSASAAANRFGWTVSTYLAHENGTRGLGLEEIEKYSKAFRTDKTVLAFGPNIDRQTGRGIPHSTLRQVLNFVFEHDGAKNSDANELADLIIDLCEYVSQSGETGLANIVDFEVTRRAARSR